MRLLAINGPNLNLLGTRQPEVYGSTTLAELEDQIAKWGEEMGARIDTMQSNGEEHIIEAIHSFDGDGIVINPGAFTHTSRAIADAIAAVSAPVVEVHISNIRRREPWRAVSFVTDVCDLCIYGRGFAGYRAAIRHLVNRAAGAFETVRYGPHHDNIGDFRRGGDDLVVLAHGGVWKHEFARDLTESLAVDLTRRGYSTWNIEYRRLGDGGGWPGSGHDVLTALDSAPRLQTDLRRLILVGHSAGAYLLMWAAARARVPVDVHIALGPLLSLTAAVEAGDVGAVQCQEMLGQGAPPEPDPAGVETVLVHGDDDQIVPVARSVAFAARQGIEHHHTSCDHFSLLDPERAEWSWVVDRIGSRDEHDE
ncbi:MAG TPA: type II 3-dehydroquinate dehydratase [Acidimicrobiia bacterium]|nr:type II 3-dehydroquinate dehydratase [Acidimicrobiia bacterium]